MKNFKWWVFAWSSLGLLFFAGIASAGPYPGGTSPHSHQGPSSGGRLTNPGVDTLYVTNSVTSPTGVFGNLTTTGTVTLSSTSNVAPNYNLIQNGNFTQWTFTGNISPGVTTTTLNIPRWSAIAVIPAGDWTMSQESTNVDVPGTYVLKNVFGNTHSVGTYVHIRQEIPNPKNYAGKTLYLQVRNAVGVNLANNVRAILSDGNTTSYSLYTPTSPATPVYYTLVATLTVTAAPSILYAEIQYDETGSGQPASTWYVGSVSITEGAGLPFRSDPIVPVFPYNTFSAGVYYTPGITFADGSGWGMDSSSKTISAYFPDGASATLIPIIISTNNVSIRGTVVADNAPTGWVGEYVSSAAVAAGPPTSGQWADMVSISLTAGDWDISVMGDINPGTSATQTNFGVSTTSGNSATGLLNAQNLFTMTATMAGRTTGVVPAYRVSINSTTTYYLKMNIAYTGGGSSVNGLLAARRVR